MTKPKNKIITNANNLRDEVTLTFTDIAKTLSRYEQQKEALIALLSAGKWDHHLTVLEINGTIVLGDWMAEKLNMLAAMGGGGISSSIERREFSVMTTLKAGRDIHEKGGLIITAYDEFGNVNEMCLWFKEPPRLDQSLLRELLDNSTIVDHTESNIGENSFALYRASKPSTEKNEKRGEQIMAMTTRSKRGTRDNELLHMLKGGLPAEIVDIEPGILVTGLRG